MIAMHSCRRLTSQLRAAAARSSASETASCAGGCTRRRLFSTSGQEPPAGNSGPWTSVAESMVADKEKLRLLIRKQIQLEATTLDTTVQRYNEMASSAKDRYAGGTLPAAKRLLTQWYKPLVAAIEAEQQACRANSPGIDRRQYGPYIGVLSAKEFAIITLHSVLSLLMRGENIRLQEDQDNKMHEAGVIKTVKAVSYIGEAVQSQINLERLKHAARELRKVSKEKRTAFAAEQAASTETELAEAPGVSQRLSNEDDSSAVMDMLAPIYSDAEERNANWVLSGERIRNLKDVRAIKTHMLAVSDKNAQRFGLKEMDGRARVKLGSALLDILIQTCKVKKPGPEPGQFVEGQAFHSSYVNDKISTRRYGSIAWDDAVMNIINDENVVRLALQPRYLPMLVPARAWSRFDEGGHLILESLMMRGGYSRLGPSLAQLKELQRMQREMDEEGAPGARKVMQALTILGQVPWRINDSVLRVMEDVWVKLGGGIAGLPPREDMFLPVAPMRSFSLRRKTEGPEKIGGQLLVYAHVSEPEMGYHRRTVKKARAQRLSVLFGVIYPTLKKRRAAQPPVATAHALPLPFPSPPTAQVRQKNRELQSLRCDFVYKLQVAMDLRNAEAIYYPHNVDFRGRAYTMHPHLNHLGADNCRGLLMFADARPLGKEGLRWLFIQATNSFASGGVDKFTLPNREKWARDHLDDLLDSANKPLEGRRFWLKAEDPWQFLAACFELRDAMACPNPEDFLSRLPCHQDGSCNGLQHYAALGRDEPGGRSVNVLPGEKPADVYTGIANLVREKVTEELNSDDPNKVQMAKLILAQVDRKLVKQTVMTSVYGVTFVGARMQIQNRLKERGAISAEGLRYRAACYAAKMTLSALNNMFSNARAVMEWLTHCAMVISDGGEPVRWCTPLGLPVVQPYRSRTKSLVRTVLQTFSLQSDDETRPVVKLKQRSAFPPNFIHSVDSSHMMLTAIGSHEAGLTFAGVHDSFWTHASSIPLMNHILREKFIELHDEPMLMHLYDTFCKEYPQLAANFRKPPQTGTLQLDKVRESVYFFS